MKRNVFKWHSDDSVPCFGFLFFAFIIICVFIYFCFGCFLGLFKFCVNRRRAERPHADPLQLENELISGSETSAILRIDQKHPQWRKGGGESSEESMAAFEMIRVYIDTMPALIIDHRENLMRFDVGFCIYQDEKNLMDS